MSEQKKEEIIQFLQAQIKSLNAEVDKLLQDLKIAKDFSEKRKISAKIVDADMWQIAFEQKLEEL